MSQPLGECVGNALEVRESIDVLRGKGPADVRELTLALAARMLVLAGRETSDDAARARAEQALASGRAWQRFLALVEAQGGDPRALDREDPALARAPVVAPVTAPRSGWLTAVRTFALGEEVVRMGGGRLAKEDRIDPAVGMVVRKRIGDRIEAGDVLAEAHLARASDDGVARVRGCFVIGDETPSPPELILERVG
jgi:pyrimidine-nucleoside phosphorylase